MTIFIQVKDNPQNFAILLVQLQPLLSESDDIYIVDSSPNREAVRLSKLYGSTRCYIFVEVGNYTWEKAYTFAWQNMMENSQEGILCISEDAVISQTFISNMKKAAKLGKVICPMILETPYPQLPNNFKWYNPPVKQLKPGVTTSLSCFYKSADAKQDKIVGILEEEIVVVLPSHKNHA